MDVSRRIWSSPLILSLRRKKQLETSSDTKLDRCLTTFDLTTLGIGSTLGLGIYVLSGQVASTKAGPAIVISFFVAAVASLFAGLCYAEFGARVPKAGSAYIYSYITVGEFMAFVIGWNLVLEYLIGTASVARGYSAYIDSLVVETGWSFKDFFRSWMPINVAHLSPYPDFLAFAITIFLSVMLTIGVKESTRFNSVFTCLNILIVLFVIICGCFRVNFHNWNLSYDEVPHKGNSSVPHAKEGGEGGFFPFGVSGMMAGAATCFYGFIGFDVIATTGEEAKNPQKSIPRAISISLLLIFLAYFGVSGVQTLMWPYYDQNVDAPLPLVFMNVGFPIAKWIISIGALAGLSTSLLGAMFPLPRILYAMASDGLVFRALGDVHPRFKTPVLATLLSGLFAAFLAAIFDVEQLADMMSIGTLLAYSLVAASVVILRYSMNATEEKVDEKSMDGPTIDPRSVDDEAFSELSLGEVVSRTFNLSQEEIPTPKTANTSFVLITLSCSLIVLMNMVLVSCEDYLSEANVIAIFCLVMVVALLLTSIIALARQPQSPGRLSFKVPAVPLVPLLSIAINVYLMMKLSAPTWVRFAIWMAIGFSIYFLYGLWNSNERRKEDESPESESDLQMEACTPNCIQTFTSRTRHDADNKKIAMSFMQLNEMKATNFNSSPLKSNS